MCFRLQQVPTHKRTRGRCGRGAVCAPTPADPLAMWLLQPKARRVPHSNSARWDAFGVLDRWMLPARGEGRRRGPKARPEAAFAEAPKHFPPTAHEAARARGRAHRASIDWSWISNRVAWRHGAVPGPWVGAGFVHAPPVGLDRGAPVTVHPWPLAKRGPPGRAIRTSND